MYWNVLNTETGLMMMNISTTQEFIARETAVRHANMYPAFHFKVVQTAILEYPPLSTPKRVLFERGAANDNQTT